MNYKFVLTLTLFPLAWLSAQSNSVNDFKSNPNYEVKVDKDSTAEIYNKQTNLRWLKSIKEYNEPENARTADLIIDLDTLNLIYWENLYRQWGSLPASNSVGKYIAIDANNNDKQEIYLEFVHREDPNNTFSSIRIYEQMLDSIFSFIYEFPIDTLGDIFDVGDITGDGLLDLICKGTKNNLRFFKQNSADNFITQSNIDYDPFPIVYQPNDVTFYDIDGDGNQEVIYYLFAGDGDSLWAYSNHIAKYNPEINNYELIYYHRPQPEYFTSGISIGDFDQDGKGNFATGSIGGKLYIYGFVQDNEYQVEFTQELETFNAFLTTMTDDMDGNGKPELWLGGDFSSSLYGGVTRLFAFEASSPGIYTQVYQIDIRGLFSAIYGNLNYVDLDGDGVKELFLTNANLAFGFKYDGNGNYYMEFIKAMPILDSVYVFQFLENVDVADLDGDGIVEIIPQDLLNKGWLESWENRSILLKRDKLTNMVDITEFVPTEFELLQNYPNPFNPSTTVRFSIPQEAKVNIKVYNILGKEIKLLLEENLPAGENSILWDGKDNEGSSLPSGIYFIQMTAGKYRQTIKTVLLK